MRQQRTAIRRTPIRRKSKARKIKQELDLILRDEVFARDDFKCWKCHKGPPQVQIQAAHVFCKNRWASMRFIVENIMTLCGGDHMWWHDQPTESGHWFRTTFPERYEQLKHLSLTAPKITRAGLKRLLGELRNAATTA